MGDRDFSIGSRKFQLSKLDAFKQFHIVRRIGPILADILPVLKNDFARLGDAKTLESMKQEEQLDLIAKIVSPVMSGLSKLTDTDADIVLFGLLQAVEVQQASGNWARIAANNMLMIQDIELPVLLNAAGRAFVYNLSGFFGALPR